MSDKRLTEGQMKFVELYCDPNRPTVKEIANILGVSERTIYAWKQKPEVIKAIKSYTSNSIVVSALPNVLTALVKEAERGNVSAIKILLTHLGLLQSDLRIKQQEATEVVSDKDQNAMNEQKIIDLRARMERLKDGNY